MNTQPTLFWSVALIALISAREAHGAGSLSCTFEQVYGASGFIDACMIKEQPIDDQNYSVVIPDGVVGSEIEGVHIVLEKDVKFFPQRLAEVLPTLQSLRIYHCSLEDIPAQSLKNLRHLKYLDLDNNKIRTIEDGAFDDLVELELLYLPRNQIVDLNQNLFRTLGKVNELGLQGNQIEVLRENLFDPLVNLKTLSLSENKLTHLNDNTFSNLANMSSIKLSDNELQAIGENLFKHNSKLEFIGLERNSLKRISTKIIKETLKIVFFAGNDCIDSVYSSDMFENLRNDLTTNCTSSNGITNCRRFS